MSQLPTRPPDPVRMPSRNANHSAERSASTPAHCSGGSAPRAAALASSSAHSVEPATAGSNREPFIFARQTVVSSAVKTR